MFSRTTRIRGPLGALLVLLTVGACSSAAATPTPAATSSAMPSSALTPAATASPTGPNYSGQTIHVLGPIVGAQADELKKQFKAWEDKTGGTVVYEGTQDFTTVINTRTAAGNPPDIALVAQPGLVPDLARAGYLQDLSTVLDVNQVKVDLIPGLYDLGTVDGKFYALMQSVEPDSLVWYSPAAFSAKGYQVPTTWEDTLTLTKQIAADTGPKAAPWCIGISAGDATGWPVTHWVEDFMLRTVGPDKYDQWGAGKLKFNSPEVRTAFQMFADLAFAQGNVLGGRSGMLSTQAGDDIAPLVSNPPGCYLYRNGSWVSSYVTKLGGNPGTDPKVIAMPKLASGWSGTPMTGGGDFAVLLTKSPAAADLMRFFATPDAELPLVDSGRLSPLKSFPSDKYPAGLSQQAAQIIASADVFRFDATDAMPAPVQTEMYKDIAAWVNGQMTLDQMLPAIDAAWPKS